MSRLSPGPAGGGGVGGGGQRLSRDVPNCPRRERRCHNGPNSPGEAGDGRVLSPPSSNLHPTFIPPSSHLHPTLTPSSLPTFIPPSSHPHPKFSPHFLSPASASDTTEVIGAVGESVTFRSHNPDSSVALWSFGSDPIVTVVFRSPPRLIFFEDKFKTRFAACENGHALSIRRLTMEDAGTYSVTIGDKKSTFTLQVFWELAEPTVTCEAQNCSGGSCSSSLRCSVPGTGFGNVSYTWNVGDQTWNGSSVWLQVNETSQDGLEPVTCTARNAVSSRNVTVTNLGQLCAAITTPSTGAHSGSWIRIGVVAGVEIASLLSIFLVSYCKYKCSPSTRSVPMPPAATRTVPMPPAASWPGAAPKSTVPTRPRQSSQNPRGRGSTAQPWLSHDGLCSFHGN
ncbi:uncharacterized protein LOC141725638 [Zonotrichia albicollis]|uniref:uncharacterized protein LOC141725638 n=1 Tax=Zonotrichia albicollis TaxID=44394 RepID=UPI003D8106E2